MMDADHAVIGIGDAIDQRESEIVVPPVIRIIRVAEQGAALCEQVFKLSKTWR